MAPHSGNFKIDQIHWNVRRVFTGCMEWPAECALALRK